MRRILIIVMLAMPLYFGLVLATTGRISSAKTEAQTMADYNSARIAELERRINTSDSEHYGERMARIEAQVETANRLSIGTFSAVFLMILERVLARKIRRSTEVE